MCGLFQLCNDAGGDHCIARRSPTPSNTLQPSQTLPTLQPHDCHWSLQSHLTPLQCLLCHMYEFDVFAIFTWHTIEWLFEPQDIMIKILDGVATFECVEYLTIVILLLYIVVGTITSFYVWQQWSCLLWSKHFVLSLKTHSGEKCHQCEVVGPTASCVWWQCWSNAVWCMSQSTLSLSDIWWDHLNLGDIH